MTRLSVQCLVYWQQLLRIPSTITLLLQCTEYSIHPTLLKRIWTSCEIRTMKDVIYSGNIQQRVLFININCVILGSAGSQRPEFACPKIGAATNNRVFTGIHWIMILWWQRQWMISRLNWNGNGQRRWDYSRTDVCWTSGPWRDSGAAILRVSCKYEIYTCFRLCRLIDCYRLAKWTKRAALPKMFVNKIYRSVVVYVGWAIVVIGLTSVLMITVSD